MIGRAIVNVLISILLILSIPGLIHAADLNSSGISHPFGITPGGLGTSVTSHEKTFNITGGTRKGSNLFHSFSMFNLHSGERAVFHDSGIRNTISRVTGGDYSWVNGTIESGAENLYLINPHGVMFGPDAFLDLDGSFHATTADYLRLGENDSFFSVPGTGDILSSADPSAFGFLDHNAAPITYQGKETSEQDNTGSLGVAESRTLSLVGGDIHISSGNIKAPGGQISLSGVLSPGEVIPTKSGMDISCSEKGNITLTDKSLIDVSGTGAGSIFIQGGRFVASDSDIYARTLGDKNGGVTDIRAHNISLENGAAIFGNTLGTGKSPDIVIQADESFTVSGGNAGTDNSVVYAGSGIPGEPSENLGDTGISWLKQKIFHLQTVLEFP
ncbi:MAG: filamentous hemagglutinin N-terminal domain-containing protein [Desulfobacteraceae bacterium]|nr:filamentous hemagglutinin N-terminal domain-containing protein [Desulfobacteraceae bacterium]